MKKILVLCTGNSCRSQMAEGYLRHFARNDADIYSAGVEVHGVNPTAVAIMHEDGIDISMHTSNHVDEYSGVSFDHIVTVCDNAKERCPYFTGHAKRHHRDFPDPSQIKGTEEEILKAYRETRQMIKDFSLEFCNELKNNAADGA